MCLSLQKDQIFGVRYKSRSLIFFTRPMDIYLETKDWTMDNIWAKASCLPWVPVGKKAEDPWGEKENKGHRCYIVLLAPKRVLKENKYLWWFGVEQEQGVLVSAYMRDPDKKWVLSYLSRGNLKKNGTKSPGLPQQASLQFLLLWCQLGEWFWCMLRGQAFRG